MNLTTIPNRLDNTTFNETNHITTAPLAQRSHRPLKALHRLLLLAAILFAGTTAWGQTNYVFYNGTYGYLYNDNGTLKSSADLRFDKSSVWTASGTIGGDNRTIQSYTDGQYLGAYGSLSGTAANWRGTNNYLAYRYYGNNYYLLATSATTFDHGTQNSGNRYNYYTVTIDDIAAGVSDFEITGGVSSFNAAGSSTYGHTNATYCDQAYTHYNFNGNNYYVNASNVSRTTNPSSTITTASAYSWSLSDNADGYATVNSSTGVVTVTNIPTSGNLTITLTCTVTSNNQTVTATKSITLTQTGVSGGIVTLDDREDHNWTYYSGVPSSVDGGNYNTNYEGKLYFPDPRNVKITYKANGGAVSIDESETEFVYYKTIEKIDGAYKYTVISNPFSKRPDGKGFGGWRIKEGANYISGYNDEAILPLDQELTLTNLNTNYTTNCISAEIELEATWVNLNNITYANGNTITYNVSGGNYETNILVLNRNVTGVITTSSPVTIMMVEPDGSADYRNDYTFTGNITPNNTGVTKIEFTKWNSDNTLNCNNHSVTVGRGMTTTSQCANYVEGVTGNTANRNLATYNSNLNYHLKLESGTFTDVSFISGTEGTNGYVNCNGTSNQIKGTLGNDYDRAREDNTKLNIIDELYLGYRPTYANGNQNNANFTCWVKSGNLGSGINITNTTFDYQGNPNGGYYGDASQTFYVSSGGTQTYIGKRKLYVEGGILPGIAGGIDENNPANEETFFLRMTGGTVRGVVYGSGAFAASSGIRRFVITGGTINGWVAAGCNGTDPSRSGGTLPSDTYIYIGGTTHVGNTTDVNLNTSSDGNVFGAGSGNAAQATTGQVNNSNVVIADKSYVKNNVFGGGNYGYSNATATVYVTGGEVNGSVFGGSNQKQGVNAVVNMTGGQVNTGMYGGSNVTGTLSGSVTMNINGGQVGTSSNPANIHGGGFGNATRISQNIDITLGKNCNATEGVTVYGDVYGGSALGLVNGTSATNTYHTYVTLNAGTIHGSLYGGGLGNASNDANVYGPVQVKVFGGSVKKTDANGANGSGAVYGCNNISGAPQRAVSVDIYGTDPQVSDDEYALFAVYGGGNQANYSYGTPTVTVHNCDNSIEYVYGGGNAAHITNGNTDVTIYGGNKIGNVFGGGNGTVTAANVSGNTNVKIYGGTILRVFGGSNSQGTIGGTISVNATAQTESGTDPCSSNPYTRCALKVGELYGGGNLANSNVGSITIGCMNDGDMVDYVYGGANQANITGNINLTMTGGRVGNLFGGNNISGTISGTITVTVDWNNSCSNNYLGNVFGGGNLATFGTAGSPKAPTVNILNGTVSENVYGGGKGLPSDHSKGLVTGNPIVNIGDADRLSDNNVQAVVSGSVFGGGDAGNVTGSPVVSVVKCNTEVTTAVYGGGNAADVTGNPSVTVDGGTIGDVYGGGNGEVAAANVTGNTSVTVHGGTINRVFAGSNTSGTITGTKSLHLDHTSSCAGSINEVFGGNNLAVITSGGITTTIDCNTPVIDCGDLYGGSNLADITGNVTLTVNGGKFANVYGGSKGTAVTAANINGNVKLNIYGGDIERAYGGSNVNGNITGTIGVDLDWSQSACSEKEIDYIYGASNQASYTPTNTSAVSPTVKLINGTVGVNVYGGGRGASATVTSNPKVIAGDATTPANTATVTGDVFGGGDAAPVVGNTDVTVTHTTHVGGNVYGGGNQAPVSANTTVTLSGDATVNGDVFGGGNQGPVNGNTHVTIQE